MGPREAVLEQVPWIMPKVAMPLVLRMKTVYFLQAREKNAFLSCLGIDADTRAKLPVDHPQMLSLRAVMDLNPYPPLLLALDPTREPDHAIFGYLDRAGSYCQVTFFLGESDYTPSIFVDKGRNASGGGDYFVSYAAVSRQSTDADHHMIHSFRWSAWEGGSSNGFEELDLALLLSPLEGILLVAGFTADRRRRARRTAASPP